MLSDGFLRFVAGMVKESLVRDPRGLGRRIFLGGAAVGTAGALRDRVADGLRDRPKKYWYDSYDIYYPETLFEGLMAGAGKFDLLTLENALAGAVDAVVLVVESAGTLTELGAFANHEQLSEKLVVLVDQRHRHKKSFVRQGPIQLLEKKGAGRVLYFDFKNSILPVDEIHDAIGTVAKNNPVEFDFSNVLHAPLFVTPCLFVLERLTRQEIEGLVSFVTNLGEDESRLVASSAISLLLRDRTIVTEGDGFRLTESGALLLIEDGFMSGRLAGRGESP